MVAFRTTFGSTATFFCNRGFRLSGDRQRVCLASGDWTGSIPTCIGQTTMYGAFVYISEYYKHDNIGIYEIMMVRKVLKLAVF